MREELERAQLRPMDRLVANAAVDFFNQEVVSNLGSMKSKTDPNKQEKIIKMYKNTYGDKQSFQVSKQILKDMNGSNNQNQMMDLAGQTLFNAERIVKEKIEIMENKAKKEKFKLNGSIDPNGSLHMGTDPSSLQE